MRSHKGDLRKSDIVIIGVVLHLALLVVIVALLILGWGHQTVQPAPATGTIAIETAKEQLIKLQHDNDRSLNAWVWNSGAAIFSSLVIVIGGLFGLWRWRVDRRDALDKDRDARKDVQDKDLKDKAEERFKTAVAALGDEKEGTQVGGAILLRSFLNPADKENYGRYYTQIFDLAVAYLRLPRTPNPPAGPKAPLLLTPLSQVLINVFTEAFPLAREKLKEEQGNKFNCRSLDASYIHLDKAYLWKADLKEVYMPRATLRETDLSEAQLNGAALWRTDLRNAKLWSAHLDGANLGSADLRKADLREADLYRANLSGAILREADLGRVRNLEEALSLEDTDLRGVTGLSNERLNCCPKGAVIDEAPTSSPSQSTVSPPAPSQSTNDSTCSSEYTTS